MATYENVKFWGEARNGVPSVHSDGMEAPIRTTPYGDVVVAPIMPLNKAMVAAAEGSYFAFVNPTIGTAIDGHPAPDTVTVDTKPLILISNTHVTKKTYIDYILLNTVAVGTNGTNVSYKMDLDTSRYTSGGSDLTGQPTCLDSTTAYAGKVYVGAVVAAAETSSVRQLQSGVLRSVIQVAGDNYLFKFGDSSGMSSMITAGVAQANIVVVCPPIVLGEGHHFLLHMFAAAQTVAASYYVNIGLIQR